MHSKNYLHTFHDEIKCTWGGGNEQVMEMMLPGDGDENAKSEKPATQSEASSSKAEATTAKERPSGTLYTPSTHTTIAPAKEGLTGYFYIDSGASNHLVPSKGDLRVCIEFEQAVEIAATNRGKLYAYGAGYLRVAPASVIEWEGNLEGQGWDICLKDGVMELQGQGGVSSLSLGR